MEKGFRNRVRKDTGGFQMRSNPKHNNTCAERIGTYREDACYDCKFLSECDQHYNEETGTWDYVDAIGAACMPKKRKKLPYQPSRSKRKCNPPNSPNNVSRQAARKRKAMIKAGLIDPVPKTNLEQAIEAAGL